MYENVREKNKIFFQILNSVTKVEVLCSGPGISDQMDFKAVTLACGYVPKNWGEKTDKL
jgi:hypothetical protein